MSVNSFLKKSYPNKPCFLASLLSICASVLTLVVSAQTVSDTLHQLQAVEISASRLNQFALGHNTYLLDSCVLKRYVFETLDAVLNEQTPVAVRFYGSGLTTVSLRGSSSSQTAIVWNGVNIQNSLSGTPDYSLFNSGSFSKVQVVMGGESALYGGGAIGGAVILESGNSELEGVHAQVGVSIAEYNTSKTQAGLSFKNNRWCTKITGGYKNATNDFEFKNTAVVGLPIEHLQNSAYFGGYMLGSVSRSFRHHQTLQLSAWLQNNTRQIAPTMLSSNDFAVQTDNSLRYVAVWQKITDTRLNNTLAVRLAYLDDDLRYNSLAVSDSKNRAASYIAEFENNTTVFRNMPMRWGVNYTFNKSLSNNLTSGAKRDHKALFFAQKWITHATTFSLNARQEMVDGILTPFTASVEFEKTIRQSSLNSIVWRGNIARSFNLPALNDLYWNQLGNPNLLPEQGYSAETGINFVEKKPDPIKLNVTIFYRRVKNQIVWLPQTDGNWRPNNLASVNALGFEFQTEKKMLLSAVSALVLKLQYAFTRATDENNFQVIYVPEHTGTAQLGYSYKQSTLVFNSQFNSKRFSARDNSTWADAFTVSNMRVTQTFNFKDRIFVLGIYCKNIFNANYQAVQYYPMARRIFELNGALRF